uniref:Ricin B-type lectin domain-containing protein n=1 Tax=Globodera pallida TaxID=36090 RepID=A0A183CMZ8_GLOPA
MALRRLHLSAPSLYSFNFLLHSVPSSLPFSLLLLFSRLLSFLPSTLCASVGSTTAQCPDGHFLSRFSSAFDGNERFYKFSCAKFHGGWTAAMLEERCEATELTRMEDGGDAYLSCGSDQYTAGVRVVDGALSGDQRVEWWQLLCCQSDSILVRVADCVETKFINDIRRSSSFSSGAQVIRRWQAMFDNGDRRWWLQICPVDVNLPLKKHKLRGDGAEVRARRAIPLEWRRSRFPTTSIQHFHHYTFADDGVTDFRRQSQISRAKVNSYAVPTLNGGRRQIGIERGKNGKSQAKVADHPTTTGNAPTYWSSASTTPTATAATQVAVAEKEEEDEQTVDVPNLMTSSDLPNLMTSSDLPNLMTSSDLPNLMTSSDLPNLMTSTDLPNLMSSSPPSPRQLEPFSDQQRRLSRLHQFNGRMRSRFESRMDTSTTASSISTTTEVMTTNAKKKPTKKMAPINGGEGAQREEPTDALDYYDMLALFGALPKTKRKQI